MFIPCVPLTHDAPKRCRPWGTAALVALHLVLFLWQVAPALFGRRAQLSDQIVFTIGVFNPFLWVSSHFLHGQWVRTLVELLFLWTFGSLVESRLGTVKFLIVYVGILMGGHALWDLALDRWPQYVDAQWHAAATSGLSLTIYALITMAIVWSPAAQYTCGAWIWVKLFVYELPLGLLAFFFVLADLALVLLATGAPLDAAAHASGIALGFILAVVCLLFGIVEGQSWDLFSVMRGKTGEADLETMRQYRQSPADAAARGEMTDVGRIANPSPQEIDIESSDTEPPDPVDPATIERQRQIAIEFMRTQLAQRDHRAATLLYQRQSTRTPDWLGQTELAELIDLLFTSGQGALMVPPLEEYVRRFPNDVPRRLLLAELTLRHLNRPQAAHDQLGSLLPLLTDPAERAQAVALLAEATQRIDEGELELEGD